MVKLTGNSELRKVFYAMGGITDEATLNFSPLGLELREMNPSSISMLSTTLKPSLLPVYEAGEGC